MKKKASEEEGRRPSATFRVGAIALVFLIIGYQSALFVYKASVSAVVAHRDRPDTVFVVSTPVSEVMTAKPLFIRDDAYAVDLLKVFERKRIDDLPVCDASGRVLGVVDIQDLPKMKVL